MGADGSWGNFTIYQGGGLPELANDVRRDCDNDPDYFKFRQSDSTWCAVGVRNFLGEQWGIELYGDTSFVDPLVSIPGGYDVPYVVLDGHNLPEEYRGIKVTGPDDGDMALAEFEGGKETLTVGGNYFSTWPFFEVVEMYDIWLEPGEYSFHLERMETGIANLDLALYNLGDPYYGARNEFYQSASSNNWGAWEDESFTCEVTQADWFGLCISSRTDGYGEFRLHIHLDGSWSGDVSTDWHDPLNWYSLSVPDSTTNVVITAGRLSYPIIEGASAHCDDLEVKPGASLTLNHDLHVGGHALVAGDLHMADEYSVFNVAYHFYCEPGCDLDMAENTQIRISGNLVVETGALVDPQAGTFIFEGYEGSEIQNHDYRTSFHNIEYHKYPGLLHFSSYCTEDFAITGNLILLNDAGLQCDSEHRVKLSGGIYKLPGSYFNFNAGKFMFSGSNSNLTTTAMDYFNDLTLFDSEIDLQSDLYVNGELKIISGHLNLGSYDLYLQGHWNNHAGAGVLGTATGTVHFCGVDADQALIGDTDFPTLHLQNFFGELYCPSGAINCDNWQWTVGALHIDGAVFNAADIVSTTLRGEYIVDAGELNLYQDAADYVDLNAGITITGGTMRVFGGYPIDSYWPYTQDASITMSDGVLDFVDNGIYLYDGAYLLTDVITGGTIRTSGNFTGARHDFNPGGGTIELYGGNDADLGHGIGSSFHDVRIDKEADRQGEGAGDRLGQGKPVSSPTGP